MKKLKKALIGMNSQIVRNTYHSYWLIAILSLGNWIDMCLCVKNNQNMIKNEHTFGVDYQLPIGLVGTNWINRFVI